MLDKIKYQIVGDHFQRFQNADGKLTVLDVGCRDTVLKSYLPQGTRYAGVDLFQNDQGTVEYVQDLTRGLPIDDRSWDVVTALDVVEHIDDMQAALSELWRVCGRHLIVVLPNMAHIRYRLNFLLSGHTGTDKYDLVFPGNLDRHRWFTTLIQSDAYMRCFAESAGADLEILHATESPSKARLARIARMFGLGPQFWAWTSIYTLSRRLDSVQNQSPIRALAHK